MQGTFVRHLYFTVVTVVTLAIMVTSFGFMIHTALLRYVFAEPDAKVLAKGFPPSLYFPSTNFKEATTIQACKDDVCTLTTEDRQSIDSWKEQYLAWQTISPYQDDTRNFVNALSFFLVATPLFFFHVRFLLRKSADTQGHGTIFTSIYLYTAALGTLITSVIFGAMLINTTLRTWVFPVENNGNGQATRIAEVFPSDTQPIDSLENCKEQCELSQDTVELARSWQIDYERAQEISQSASSWHNDFSRSVAALLVTLPVFAYHWYRIRKKISSDNVIA